MKNTDLRKLLDKYQQGEATDVEKFIVDTWYASFEGETDPSSIPEWSGLASREAMKARLWRKMLPAQRVVRWYQSPLFRLAAVIAVVLSISITVYLAAGRRLFDHNTGPSTQQTLTAFHTGVRELKKVTLADGTIVWLNANSHLKVLPEYGAETRQVALRGEAFFEVKKNPKVPFRVQTGSVDVEVLGTAFNLSAYPDIHDVKVGVASGKVAVNDSKKGMLATLVKGQGLVYHKAVRSYRLTNYDAQGREDWRNGTMRLDEAPFEEIAQVIFNFYGIKLHSELREVNTANYTITLRATMSVDESLALICTMVNKKYRKEKNGDVTIF